MVLPRIQPPVVQWEYICLRQYSHLPQALTQEIRTWSPALNAVTAVPTCSTMPTPSWPRIRPGWQVGASPLEDVQVGAVNRRFGDPDDGVGGCGDLRFGTVFQGLLSRALINERLHFPCGWRALGWF